jgi:hypothetical protein
MALYFAYGSNMNQEGLDQWCKCKGENLIRLINTCAARLNNYHLVFNYFSVSRNGGVANIMVSRGACVYGLLSEVTDADLATLRVKEGCPNCYEEIEVTVEKFDGTIVKGVKTYKVVPACETTDHQPPTRQYLSLIMSNVAKNNLPDSYIEYLRSTKTG